MCEHFLGFIAVVSESGLGVTEAILKHLHDFQIPVSDMRGQGYDKGANMKGENLGI